MDPYKVGVSDQKLRGFAGSTRIRPKLADGVAWGKPALFVSESENADSFVKTDLERGFGNSGVDLV